jgi:hypothetical protein
VSLAETQRRLRELLAAPSGVGAALASPEEREACAVLVRGARGVDGLARLEVYANAYFARIRDVLAECFPASAASLGEPVFDDLVTAYLLAHPPHHFSIRRVGDALPAFLASEDGGLPFRRRAPALADLAALECARLDAFDALDSPVVGREALAMLAPERWGALRLRFVPSLRLLRLAWPVEKVWAAHEHGEPVPEIAPLAHSTCVWRRRELRRPVQARLSRTRRGRGPRACSRPARRLARRRPARGLHARECWLATHLRACAARGDRRVRRGPRGRGAVRGGVAARVRARSCSRRA